jgi:hypothetical protein
VAQNDMTVTSAKPQASGWQRHLFYRKEVWRTTWKLRLSIVFLAAVMLLLTKGFWIQRIGQSLVCDEQSSPSDALLVENFDPDYLVFERTVALQRAGIAPRILIPVQGKGDPETPSPVLEGFTEVMARVAHLDKMEIIPIVQTEPISLNTASQIRTFLTNEHVRSIVVVTPGFRSRRSYLIYNSVLAPAGITVRCVPVFGTRNTRNWTATWHGIQEVALQFGKLQYYRFYVLL